jgi:hypothetical protein
MGPTGDRALLAGRWHAGPLQGRYLFAPGLGDNYLELSLDARLASRLKDFDCAVSGTITLQPFNGGLGLSVLETLQAHEPRAAPAARLAALVMSLQRQIPGLEVLASRTNVDTSSDFASDSAPILSASYSGSLARSTST